METENYKGISLLNASYRLLSDILLTRINPYTREIIGEYQAGCMKGKSTIDRIYIVKQVVEKSHKFNKDIHLFAEFKAAYNSITREKLWEVMGQLGIPAKLTRLIKACSFNSKIKIRF